MAPAFSCTTYHISDSAVRQRARPARVDEESYNYVLLAMMANEMFINIMPFIFDGRS